MLDSLLSESARASLACYAAQAPWGDFAEVGVYRGGSAQILYEIAQQQGRRLYLFDTFAGMPFHGPLDGNKTGAFADCSVAEIVRAMPDAIICQGVFPGSLFDVLKYGPIGPLAFVHADADQYESTRAICCELPPLMVPGGMILFDDYRVSGCDGCTAAVDRYLSVELTDAGKGLWVNVVN